MRTLFRDPQVEESIHTIVLQNRCGNRLSLLVGDGSTDLELVYKPNAFRRKEYRARNFSNRDVFTTPFAAFSAHELRAAVIRDIDYDPFVTRLRTEAPSGAKNDVTFVNVADENCFAIAASRPLTLTIRPRRAFEVADGLLSEGFVDRTEPIVSFVHFPGIEKSRYRVLCDGTHVLQLLDDDVILVGAEETAAHVARVIDKLGRLSLDELIAHGEALIRPVTGRAALEVSDASVQRIVDLNKRFVYSAMDEGGACFGAMNRIYHLIWTRDGAMHASQYAMAGFVELVRLWAPFLLSNPATIRQGGRSITAWQQLFGTRWTKGEDDGLFYATWTLFTHFVTTGDDSLLRGPAMELLLAAVEDAIATRLDPERMLFVSDTRGESTLASSPYYGYDIVNGTLDAERVGSEAVGRTIARSISLYNNVLYYNVLRMALVLLEQRPELSAQSTRRYAELATQIGRRIDELFLDERGEYRAEYLFYTDGTEGFVDPGQRDFWEFAWALALTPFHPNLAAAVRSARAYVTFWPSQQNIGFCPWNALAGLLLDHGLPAADARAMLNQEIEEALQPTKKYPMRGLLTEYATAVESWRGLPFSAGSFNLAITSMLLRPLPQGVSVRPGGLVRKVRDFVWGVWHLFVETRGEGPAVQSVTIDGRPLTGTLQLPEARLRRGKNTVVVTRGATHDRPRLHASSLLLLDAEDRAERTLLSFAPAAIGEVVVENAPAAVELTDQNGRALATERTEIPETRLSVLAFACPDGALLQL
jgi:hypothetical protein